MKALALYAGRLRDITARFRASREAKVKQPALKITSGQLEPLDDNKHPVFGPGIPLGPSHPPLILDVNVIRLRFDLSLHLLMPLTQTVSF